MRRKKDDRIGNGFDELIDEMVEEAEQKRKNKIKPDFKILMRVIKELEKEEIEGVVENLKAEKKDVEERLKKIEEELSIAISVFNILDRIGDEK